MYETPPTRRRIGAVFGTALMTATLVGASISGADADPGDGSGSRNGSSATGDSRLPDAQAKRKAGNPEEVGRSGTQLGNDEIGRSKNVKHLTNIAPSGPLASGTGTDIAFRGDKAFVGNYNGFTIYDVKNPKKPKMIAQVNCPGAQNDVSVSGNLLYLGTDSSRSDDSCASTAQSATKKESWEGVKIFDISNLKSPRYIKSVETACGSHTQTLVPGLTSEFLYISSYAPDDSYPDCKTPHDGISIIEIPKKKPTNAKVVATPVLFPKGGHASTSGCHDITVFPKKKIAAGACMGDGIIMDITNPIRPKVIERVTDRNFSFWHSATFNNEGTKIVFTDELGGGGAATCNSTVGPTHGANAIYDLTKKHKLKFKSYFKISRHQFDSENCVSHNGSLVPVPGDGAQRISSELLIETPLVAG